MTEPNRPEDREVHPWLGLLPYEESDAFLFFGRSREIDELTHTIIEGPQTTIFGPSGVGKTSLLRAGVFPRLEARHFLPVYIRLEHGQGAADFVQQAMEAVRAVLPRRAVEMTPLAQRVAPDLPESLWEFLHRHEWWDARNHLVKPVLVFDQFEEMFTLAWPSLVERLITDLGDLCGNSPPRVLDEFLAASGRRLGFPVETQNYRVVLCLREDFLARLEELIKVIPALRRNRFSLQAMNTDQAREAVLGPGRTLVDEEVARRIVEAVTAAKEGSPCAGARVSSVSCVEPALLSLFCRELNIRRLARVQADITLDLVEESHKDILREFYRRAFSAVSAETAVFVEDRLLTVSGFRSALTVDDALGAGVSLAELEELANRRVLRFEERMGLRWVELSHDVLTAVVRERRDNRRNEEALRQEHERAEASRRETARARQNLHRALGAIAALVLLVLALVGVSWHLFFRERTTYYHSVVKRYGFLEGVGELSRDEVRHRQCSFKFIQHGLLTPLWERKKVERVVAVNGQDRPTTEHWVETLLWSRSEDSDEAGAQNGIAGSAQLRKKLSSVCQWEFIGDEDNRIVYEKGYDRDGIMVWGLVYSPSAEPKNFVLGRFVGPEGFPQRQRRGGAQYVRIEYDERGHEKFHGFRDFSNKAAPGPWGAYGKSIEYNEMGQPILIASIDEDGSYMRDRLGFAVERISYDSQGRPHKLMALDPEGAPCIARYGWSEARLSYDRYGNLIELAYFDTVGNPARENAGGVHKQIFAYDEEGNRVLVRFYDSENRPGLHKEGYYGWAAGYDARGNMVEQTLLGPDGLPAAGPDGFTVARITYDGQGNMTSIRFHDGGGNPCLHKDGNHGWTGRYDERGNLIQKTFIGLDEKPAEIAGLCAIEQMAYDGRGNTTDLRFFNAGGVPCLHKEGYHAWKRHYDEGDNLILETFLDGDERPVYSADGCATVQRKYGRRGVEIEWSCFDAEGQPALNKGSGVHKIVKEYDARGRQTSARYFGKSGQPILHNDGNHGLTRRYDERGNMVEQVYLGVDGQPENIPNGYAITRYTYDSQGRSVEERYFNAQDQPTENKNGVHYGTSTYEGAGHRTELAAYGLDGNLTPFEGERVAKKRWRYDARGREAEIAFFGIDGLPVAGEEGFALVRMDYDERGNLVEIRLYGVDSQPCLHRDGYHGIRRTFDIWGKQTGEVWFDTEGNTRSPVVMVGEVLPASEAERRGIQVGDVLLYYGRWRWREHAEQPDSPALHEEIRRLMDKPKQLVFLRNGGVFFQEFPAGIMGIRFIVEGLPEAELGPLHKALEQFRKEAAGEGEPMTEPSPGRE